MTIAKIEDILMELAKRAGEDKGIVIGYIAEVGTQKGGEWEFHVPNFQSLRNDSHNAFVCSLELTYWLAWKRCSGDNSKLALSFPLNDEEEKKVIDKVSAMIDIVKSKIQSDTE